ncbi:MAG: hypothetical protein WB627_13775 [Candidatus Acidiferrum sp.]
MTILDARDVAPQQTSAMFDVALGEFLLLAKLAESVAYDHAGIIPKR